MCCYIPRKCGILGCQSAVRVYPYGCRIKMFPGNCSILSVGAGQENIHNMVRTVRKKHENVKIAVFRRKQVVTRLFLARLHPDCSICDMHCSMTCWDLSPCITSCWNMMSRWFCLATIKQYHENCAQPMCDPLPPMSSVLSYLMLLVEYWYL